MNLIGKEVHISYEYGGSVATVFGTITDIAPLQGWFYYEDMVRSATDPMMVEVTDGEDIRYIPAKNIIHIHIGKLE